MTSGELPIDLDQVGPMTPGRLPEPSPAEPAPESGEPDEDAAVADAVTDTWDG